MNRILSYIVSSIKNSLEEHLPEVSSENFENGGSVYYMNGKDGTEFEWFVNRHLPEFMVFYNNEENLGAAKMVVYANCDAVLYLYDNGGKTLAAELPVELKASEDDLLALATILKNNADNNNLWDADVESIITDTLPYNDEIQNFLNSKKNYEQLIQRKKFLSKDALVSGMIFKEGWKVGYMKHEEPFDDSDSGWQLYSGGEDDDYMECAENFMLYPLYMIIRVDPLINEYLDRPEGISLVRVSSDLFEDDDSEQEVFMERWKDCQSDDSEYS